MQKYRYVLITAARNEEHYIANTIESILGQTLLPVRWVLVSDNSTDQTDDIILRYSEQSDRLIYVRREVGECQQNFASKVFALRMGYEKIKESNMTFDFIGHLDADITFSSVYYETLLKFFELKEKLGISGGFIYEKENGRFKSRVSNTKVSVAGGIQLFRKECYEDIGGLIPIEVGGEDWHAEIMARIRGWQVEAYPELKAYHHHKTTQKRGVLKSAYRGGIMDYSLGSHPAFEIFKCLRRVKEKPFFIVAGVRLAAYLSMYITHPKRPVSDEFIEYIRCYQLNRLKMLLFRGPSYNCPH